MITVAAVFLVISWISVSLRLYVRGFMIRSLGWDDWMCLLTQVGLRGKAQKGNGLPFTVGPVHSHVHIGVSRRVH